MSWLNTQWITDSVKGEMILASSGVIPNFFILISAKQITDSIILEKR